MAVRIYTTAAGASLDDVEIAHLRGLLEKQGRITLLVSSFAERDVYRHDLAEAGLGLGVEVATFENWIADLWTLLGDGDQLVTNLERELIFSDLLSRREPEALAPLKNSMGVVRMLSRMARDLLPGVLAWQEDAGSEAEARVFELLGEYHAALSSRGLIETCDAAELLCTCLSRKLPAMASVLCVRSPMSLTYAQRLLLAEIDRSGGSVDILLAREQFTMRERLAEDFQTSGCFIECAPLEPYDPAAGTARLPRFIEVAGPHARGRAYAEEIVRLAHEAARGATEGRDVAAVSIMVASDDPAALFDELAPRLAYEGIKVTAPMAVSFEQSICGRQFKTLADLAERMKASDAGKAPKTEWWPAPELTDWLYSPASGAYSSYARTFDKNMRLSRSKTVEGTLNLLQSVQGQVKSARKKRDDDYADKKVPCVAYDAFQAIWRGKPVGALKLMRDAVFEARDTAFGLRDGQVKKQAELLMLDRAIELLTDTARGVDVAQASAVAVLDELRVRIGSFTRLYENGAKEDGSPAWLDSDPWAEVQIMTVGEAAALRPGAFDAVLFADVDLDSYPLSHEEGPFATLAAELNRAAIEVEPAARQRVLFGRAMEASAGAVLFARVTHDRQAKDRYPAAIWTELRARAEVAGAFDLAVVGEGDILADFDTAAGRHIEREAVECEAPQHLSEGAIPYLVLKHRASEDADAPLVPRLTSASQIEAYSECPLCWFVSYRVKPQTIDAGFGNMEKGNFVHDVLEHLHRKLIDNGMRRVTQQNLDQAIELLHETFDETLSEHAAKRGTEGPLVPLSPIEHHQVDEILPQLEAVLTYESQALAPFAPQYLEYSFNDKNVTYAGWPLGGRIDRVDVDAEGRAVVIDYKHRAAVDEFKLKDPTVPDKKSGEVTLPDSRWLPAHTQSLIYAQAVRRALGLDTRAGLYFSTKSGAPALRGAASWELIEEEKGDGRIPGLKDGFPGEGGSMSFDALLDRVEAGIAERLGELEHGVVAAAEEPGKRCNFNHKNAFMRRDA